MVDMKTYGSRRTRLALGAAALLGLGVAGGAGAVSLTRPSVEMAPTVATPIARLATTQGVVTVKGRVAEVYGDRFVVQDGTGRAMVSAGRDGSGSIATGRAVTVQGRYDDGQLRASYLVDPQGRVEQVGPGRGPGGRHGPEGGPGGPGHDGPPPPPPPPPGGPGGPGAGAGAPPPPPGGCGPAGAPGVGTPPPPPPAAGTGASPPPPVTGAPNPAAPR